MRGYRCVCPGLHWHLPLPCHACGSGAIARQATPCKQPLLSLTRALGGCAAGSATCSGRARGGGSRGWAGQGSKKLCPCFAPLQGCARALHRCKAVSVHCTAAKLRPCTAPQKKRGSKKRRAQKDEERASRATARGGTAPLAGRKSEAEELAARKVGLGGDLVVVAFWRWKRLVLHWRCVGPVKWVLCLVVVVVIDLW
jgi:hypothetical protein